MDATFTPRTPSLATWAFAATLIAIWLVMAAFVGITEIGIVVADHGSSEADRMLHLLALPLIGATLVSCLCNIAWRLWMRDHRIQAALLGAALLLGDFLIYTAASQ